MIKIARLILNFPWSALCFLAGITAIPTRITSHRQPFAIIMYVKKIWWSKHARATMAGNVVIISPKETAKDLEHELIHVEQYNREPFIHPFLYLYQTWRYGYRQNKYEDEAYDRAGNRYDK